MCICIHTTTQEQWDRKAIEEGCLPCLEVLMQQAPFGSQQRRCREPRQHHHLQQTLRPPLRSCLQAPVSSQLVWRDSLQKPPTCPSGVPTKATLVFPQCRPLLDWVLDHLSQVQLRTGEEFPATKSC